MAVKFHIITRHNPRDPSAPEKYYPSVKSTGRVTMNQFAEIIAEISTVSPTDTKAVMEAMVSQTPRQIAMGNVVDLGDLGSWFLKVKTSGEDSEDLVSTKNIVSVQPRFYPGKRFKEALSRIDFVKSDGF